MLTLKLNHPIVWGMKHRKETSARNIKLFLFKKYVCYEHIDLRLTMLLSFVFKNKMKNKSQAKFSVVYYERFLANLNQSRIIASTSYDVGRI